MAKSSKKNGGITGTADRSAKSSRPPTTNSRDIARRAYDLYLARGCEHGHDVEDWLQAERELRGAANSSAA